MSQDESTPSTRPYLIRALHEWCTDNGYAPYLAVQVDASVQVPREFVKNNEIVLNVSFDATSGLKLGNDYVEFKARFGGSPRDIIVPVSHVVAIYARDNGTPSGSTSNGTDGFEAGNLFDIFQDATLKAINVRMPSGASGATVGTEIFVKLYSVAGHDRGFV